MPATSQNVLASGGVFLSPATCAIKFLYDLRPSAQHKCFCYHKQDIGLVVLFGILHVSPKRLGHIDCCCHKSQLAGFLWSGHFFAHKMHRLPSAVRR